MGSEKLYSRNLICENYAQSSADINKRSFWDQYRSVFATNRHQLVFFDLKQIERYLRLENRRKPSELVQTLIVRIHSSLLWHINTNRVEFSNVCERTTSLPDLFYSVFAEICEVPQDRPIFASHHMTPPLLDPLLESRNAAVELFNWGKSSVKIKKTAVWFIDCYKLMYDVCRYEGYPGETSDPEEDADEPEKEEFFLARIESEFCLWLRDLFKRIMDSLIYHLKKLIDLEDFIQIKEITFTSVFQALMNVMDDKPFDNLTWFHTFSAWTSFFNIYEYFFVPQNQDTFFVKAKFEKKINLKRKKI
jgi:hypothetical protein